MPILHSQLALFGAIDAEVTMAKNALKRGAESEDAAMHQAVIDMVGKFLPGTTGFGQHGWYAELTSFLNTRPVLRGRNGVVFPNLPQALEELHEPGNQEHDRDPILARAVYAAVILEKIYRLTDRTGPERNDVLSILSQALISWPAVQQETDPAEAIRNGIPLINDRQSWFANISDAVSKEFAERSLSCFGALKKVDGQYCAYITTDTTDDKLTVDDIAKIIEPVNWHECCAFFCKMTPQASAFSGNGGTRVSERVSAECKEYFMETALVFWKAKLPDGSIYINYDLDSQRDKDSNLVEVDSGYLWISPIPGQPNGVRIRTSKLERVNGLSPTATAALACLLGWGSQSHEMLAGTARKYIENPVPPPVFQPFRRSPYDAKSYTEA